MKKNLALIVFSILLSVTILSCSDNNDVVINDNDNDNDTLIAEVKDYWDESNFKPLDDEFNDFREFQAGLLFPYNFANEKVNLYFKTPGVAKSREIYDLENIGNTFVWIEVTYPKNDPSKVEYSTYKIRTARPNQNVVFKDFHQDDQVADNTVLVTYQLYKDTTQVATIDRFPQGKLMININGESKLLYDFKRIAYASDYILYSDDIANTQTIYNFYELKDSLSKSNSHLRNYYFAKDQYGEKVLGVFGSLTSFLLPINGACADDMVQEVVGLREGTVERYSGYPYMGYSTNKFIYKNYQSPAAPYLPDSVWNLDDLTLWGEDIYFWGPWDL